MLNEIKRAVGAYLQSQQLMDVVYGVVTRSEPLEITIDQRFVLSDAFLVVPEHMTALTVTIAGSETVIRRGLEAGDKVALLRSSGGGQYVVAGRLTA
ncbi:DUF2577 domain-containing protein [Cohnella panacarvi]|uniref:DUF2577 domain-containing protein n=1 Tax=Cohnella panacarvi TaxID=400776 RepID=UPI00047E311F|nr:DUF2577 domain-containing protein [Cohnella panacarvi]